MHTTGSISGGQVKQNQQARKQNKESAQMPPPITKEKKVTPACRPRPVNEE